MGAAAIAFPKEPFQEKFQEMQEYLLQEDGYWLQEDKWKIESDAFRKSGMTAGKYVNGTLADFSGYRNAQMKLEMKYYLLYHMKNQYLAPFNVYNVMTTSIRLIGEYLASSNKKQSFEGLETDGNEIINIEFTKCVKKKYTILKNQVIRFITDYYDERPEFERDVWRVDRILGIKQSAAEKRLNHSINFQDIAMEYREMVKRFMSRLICE